MQKIYTGHRRDIRPMAILQRFYALFRHGESEQLRSILPLPTLLSSLAYQDFSSFFTHRPRTESSTLFLPAERRPYCLSTLPINYLMTNIFDCPNLLLSATEDLNRIESVLVSCWSLPGPEKSATFSYTYSIHIQPYLSHHMYPGHVIPVMPYSLSCNYGRKSHGELILQIFKCNRRAKQAHYGANERLQFNFFFHWPKRGSRSREGEGVQDRRIKGVPFRLYLVGRSY